MKKVTSLNNFLLFPSDYQGIDKLNILMQIQYKFMLVILFGIIPLLSQAQNGTTSVGTTSNSDDYSTAITIGETLNTYIEAEPYTIKSGIIQPIEFKETSVSETEKLIFGITPNPASGYIQITSNRMEFSEYKIFDTNSKVVSHDKMSYNKISTSGIPAGVYILQLKSDKGLHSQLFTKI